MNISNLSFCQGVTLVTLRNVPCDSGVIGAIFTTIAENGINVDMISQTAPLGQAISVAFTIPQDALSQLLPVVNGFKPKCPDLTIELAPGMTKLNFYDENMVNTPGVAANVFSVLARGHIRVTMITTSTVDISLLVPEHQEVEALALCREEYGLEPEELPFS